MTACPRRFAFLLTFAATAACSTQHLTECQEFTSGIAQAASTIMQHPLDAPHFETRLTLVGRDVAALDGIPELEPAKKDYEKKLREAVTLAAQASATTARAALINANATARARAAQATYHLMESTNLHCAGER
jgi:hypothetical protein